MSTNHSDCRYANRWDRVPVTETRYIRISLAAQRKQQLASFSISWKLASQAKKVTDPLPLRRRPKTRGIFINLRNNLRQKWGGHVQRSSPHWNAAACVCNIIPRSYTAVKNISKHKSQKSLTAVSFVFVTPAVVVSITDKVCRYTSSCYTAPKLTSRARYRVTANAACRLMQCPFK